MTVKPAVCLAVTAAAFALGVAPGAARPFQSGLILGRVVDAVTNQGVASAVVRLTAGGDGVLTASDGRFVLDALPAGTFTIAVERPGYFPAEYGKRRPSGAGIPVVLTEGQRRGDITITMWPWSSISGTIIDDLGRRVAGVPVEAIRRFADGALAPNGGGDTVTDSHGEYHIQPVTPGNYVVVARCRSVNVPIPASMTLPDAATLSARTGADETTYLLDAARRSVLAVTGPVRDLKDPAGRTRPIAYVTSYYGGANTIWQAGNVEVGPGKSVQNIDFAVMPRPAVRVSGSVAGPQGAVAGALVRILPTDIDPADIDSLTADVASTTTAENGTFALPAVPEGNYLLDVTTGPVGPGYGVDWAHLGITGSAGSASSAPGRAGREGRPADLDGYWTRTPLVVSDRDITGLALTLRAGTRIKGETVLQKPVAEGSLPSFRLLLQHGDDTPVASPALRGDRPGPLEILNVRPGWYVLEAQGLAPGWDLVSATLGGRDITGSAFEVGGGEVSGLIVTLGDRSIELRGDVLDAQGKIAPDATVVLFPANSATWRTLALAKGAKNLQAQRTQTGGYTFRGLAAGDYFVSAVDDGVLEDWPGGELLRKLSIAATRVMLSAGDRRVINLTMGRGR